MNTPDNLKYTADHEWVRVEDDILIIGITDFAQDQLSDIVYVDIEKLDEEILVGEVFGTVEAVKTLSDLIMPITAVIFELNEALETAPELVNTDPYGEGWLVKAKAEDLSGLQALLDSAAYQALVSGEE